MEKLSERIKEHRIRKGYSQDQLADLSGLNLRTIQRIEAGNTVPRGDSLQRLSQALSISPDELIDWTIKKDTSVLVLLNLSQLFLLAFPILGILVPLIIWILQKDKVTEIKELGKAILNFQITWSILILIFTNKNLINFSLFIYSDMPASIIAYGIIVSYGYNLLVIALNTFLIIYERRTFYQPCVKILR